MGDKWKRNGGYTARYSEALQCFIAEQMMPDGPMGWDPFDVVYEISAETYEHFDDPGFDAKAHLGRFLYFTKPSYNNTAESQAYYAQVKAYCKMMKDLRGQ